MTATTMDRPRAALRPEQLSRLDRELLAAMLRFGFMRAQQLAAWTGAGQDIQKHLGRMRAAGYAACFTVSVDATGADGRISPTTSTVWEVTALGAATLGDLAVPGHPDEPVHLPARRPSRTVADHVLGVVDLAVWYRRSGFHVASEREIRSLEMPRMAGRGRSVQPALAWCVKPRTAVGVHPPDLGAFAADGTLWAVELERAVKSVRAYTEVIGAYREANLGQVWHVQRSATADRLQEAAQRAGATWAPQTTPGVLVSTDGIVRLQGWQPGRVGMPPRVWARMVPAAMPAGLPDPGTRFDPTVTWRRGVAVDVDAVPVEGVIWE